MHSSTSQRVSFQSVSASATLVTITTAGAVLGLGLRAGDSVMVFRAAGGRVLAGIAANPALMVLAGSVHHLIVATAWGYLLSYGAMRLHGLMRTVACIVLIPVYMWVVSNFIPSFFQIGFGVTSTRADLFPVAAAISVALLGGAWVAKRD